MTTVPPSILLLGTFDSKACENAFLREQLLLQGCHVVTMNIGSLGSTTLFPVDVPAEEVAEAGGQCLETLRQLGDRGRAVEVMACGAAAQAQALCRVGRIDGVVGMGGSAGTTIVTQAMRGLPCGIPKLCLTTMTGANTAHYTGISDLILVPTITDVSGLNRLLRSVLMRAAAAVASMARTKVSRDLRDRPMVFASMFGNTTPCVDLCRAALDRAGYETVVFHATGSGGRWMEKLIEEDWAEGCLDLTTTEWADELCGGVLSAGPTRLDAAGRQGVPLVVAPGCLDMVNFGPLETVPDHYRKAGRRLHGWNPSVTLMRTNRAENHQLGKILAEKVNAAQGPVALLLPQQGFSLLGAPGGPFWDPDADQAFVDSIVSSVRPEVTVEFVDTAINEPPFATRAVELLLKLIHSKKARPRPSV